MVFTIFLTIAVVIVGAVIGAAVATKVPVSPVLGAVVGGITTIGIIVPYLSSMSILFGVCFGSLIISHVLVRGTKMDIALTYFTAAIFGVLMAVLAIVAIS
jgi:hypothetical protein